MHPRDIDYLKRLYIFNQDAIQGYYSGKNFSVKNTNILSRLIEHFPLYFGYDNYRYLEVIENKLTYLAKHFEFTSDIELGSIHPAYFFGNDGDEIIFSGYENFNADTFARGWRTEKCVKTLLHPRDDTRLLLPLGNDNGCRGGLSSLFIDVPKLALKYREFMRDQTVNNETGVMLNKNNFVIKYVLSGMMSDIIDHTFMNLLMDRFYGIKPTETPKKHPFKIFEPTTQLDRYLDDTLDVITSKPIDFVNILRNIKLINCEDASELLALPDFYGTRQIQSAIVGTRIDHMLFLFDVCKSKDENGHFLNDWKRLAKRMERDSQLSRFYTYDLEKSIREKLYKLQQM
ncbi:hypothetical protein [Flavobacterium sp.]|uniref:hypothetical protein n=1 Tax=Flavobacterium sp. TaxID=239 RepID=UPI0037C047F5